MNVWPERYAVESSDDESESNTAIIAADSKAVIHISRPIRPFARPAAWYWWTSRTGDDRYCATVGNP